MKGLQAAFSGRGGSWASPRGRMVVSPVEGGLSDGIWAVKWPKACSQGRVIPLSDQIQPDTPRFGWRELVINDNPPAAGHGTGSSHSEAPTGASCAHNSTVPGHAPAPAPAQQTHAELRGWSAPHTAGPWLPGLRSASPRLWDCTWGLAARSHFDTT